MNADSEEDAVGISEIAELYRISPASVYRKAVDVAKKEPSRGDIPGFKIGNRWKFFPSEVKKHMTQRVDPWAYLPGARARQNRQPATERRAS